MQMANNIWKDALYHVSLGNCKFKKWDTTTHLLEWLKSKALTTPNAGEDVEQQKISFITALEDSLAVSYKAKHSLTI